jgi:hypothetical protein
MQDPTIQYVGLVTDTDNKIHTFEFFADDSELAADHLCTLVRDRLDNNLFGELPPRSVQYRRTHCVSWNRIPRDEWDYSPTALETLAPGIHFLFD